MPLLATQRALYALSPGPERFAAYLAQVRGGTEPLAALNPMGKAHCAMLLDAYLALDADAVARERLATRAAVVRDRDEALRASLVLVDDAHGGWTHRTTCELAARWEPLAFRRRTDWLTVPLWTSAPAIHESLHTALDLSFFRTVYALRHGAPTHLRALLRQEGWAMVRAGVVFPPRTDADLADTRSILEPHAHTDATPVLVAALFGDAAAAALGYRPLGLAENAGLALAAAEARDQ